MVKSAEIQETLEEMTNDIYDTLWIGAMYDNSSKVFKWVDGEPLTYSNWQEGYPTNVSDTQHCIELRPDSVKSPTAEKGKWADVACQKRNLVSCQKAPMWSFEDAVDEIIRIRVELANALEQISVVSSRVVPVGSIYIEYHNQPAPGSLWPALTWQDISTSYAGLFFRITGEEAEEWGTTQSACAPRIREMGVGSKEAPPYFPNTVTVPESGYSPFVMTADRLAGSPFVQFGLRVHTNGCEVRPKNQAIRIWKRTA